jgi:predicted CoA-substrate-specific enzyme activase
MSSPNGSLYLGIDVGSVSTNLVLIDRETRVLAALYDRASGNPIRSVQQGLLKLRDQLPPGTHVAGVCTTGSGGQLARAVVGADLCKNEITAHARAAIHLHPEVKTLFEIGGQDSKMTVIRDGIVVDFAMNLVCAAGTGSFLDSQAKRLDIPIEEFSRQAVLSQNPTLIAGRCTVFAESDMIHKQQTGFRQEDILMGLCQALVRNYIANVCRGKEIVPPIVFQGGVSLNQGIIRAFREALGIDVIIPRHSTVMGAYGAALIAQRAAIPHTRFRGFDIGRHVIDTKPFRCPDCPNQCEILEIHDGSTLLGRSGGRCRKWERHSDPAPKTEPVASARDTTEPVASARDTTEPVASARDTTEPVAPARDTGQPPCSCPSR